MDTETPKPMVHWHDASTGETVTREMTEEELAFYSTLPEQKALPHVVGDNGDVQHAP